jgi:putative membrane protein
MKAASRVTCLLCAFVTEAGAHPLDGTFPPLQPSLRWQLEPGSVATLAVIALLYVLGLVRLWKRIGPGHGIRWPQALCFLGGWLATVVALISPLHAWGATLFSAHMVQHEILLLISAPLLVLGRPLAVMLWAMPRRARVAIGGKASKLSRAWVFLTWAPVAWVSHAAALWLWHVPAFFEKTLTSNLAHAAQHASFLGTALLFWWSLLQGHRRRAGYGSGVLYLFTTAVHTGILGALLTLAPSVWYPSYAATSGLWGLTPLEDQQLGGLIMWIPGGIVYVVAGLALFAGWMQEAGERAASAESARRAPAPNRPAAFEGS